MSEALQQRRRGRRRKIAIGMMVGGGLLFLLHLGGVENPSRALLLVSGGSLDYDFTAPADGANAFLIETPREPKLHERLEATWTLEDPTRMVARSEGPLESGLGGDREGFMIVKFWGKSGVAYRLRGQIDAAGSLTGTEARLVVSLDKEPAMTRTLLCTLGFIVFFLGLLVFPFR